ncbi:apocytochrome b [Tanacetum coccineum]
MEEMGIDLPSGISVEYFTYHVLLGEDEAGVLDPTFLTEVLADLQQPGHIVSCVEHIMRDVEGGWLLRYMHANGASMFLIVVHLHLFRGLYHASYSSPREFVRCVGVVILLLMIVTAFIGYVPPWGQMSFWGATVITSLASAIPVVGDTIVTWLWGGFSVDNATLNRFFSLHHLLPFLLVGASLLHLAALHQYGSNNPLGVHSEMDKIASYPYFYVKDLVGWVAFAIFSSIFIFYAPNVLGHPDNYIPANPMPTPPHIVPEWYFLPIHAILRSIPDKAGGVAAIAPVFICLLALPFFKKSIPGTGIRVKAFLVIVVGLFAREKKPLQRCNQTCESKHEKPVWVDIRPRMESTITLESDSMSFTWMPLSEHSLNPSLRALVSAIMIPPPALSPIAADPSMLSFPTNPVDSEYSTPHSPSHQIPPLPSSLLAPCHLIWGNQPRRREPRSVVWPVFQIQCSNSSFKRSAAHNHIMENEAWENGTNSVQ